MFYPMISYLDLWSVVPFSEEENIYTGVQQNQIINQIYNILSLGVKDS